MKRTIVFLIVAAAFLLLTRPLAAKEIRKDYHETFAVGAGSVLRLRSGDGDVTIRKWDRDEIEVRIHYLAELKLLGRGYRDFEAEFIRKDDIIEVVGREKSSGTFGFQIFDVKEYTYTIKAPDHIGLDIEGDDGEIDIEGWRGDLDIKADDGDITLTDTRAGRVLIRIGDGDVDIEDLEGELDFRGDDGRIEIYRSNISECVIRNGDGDVNVRDSRGNFDIEVDDGDIDLYRVRAGRIDLLAGDGNVDIELQEVPDLDMDVRTEDGSVDISIQEGISAVFSIDVDGGRIRVDLPSAKEVQKGRHWLSGRLLGGKGRIRVRTSDGDVSIREVR